MKYLCIAALVAGTYVVWPSASPLSEYVAPKADIQMTVQTAVAAIKRQGKLLVLSTNLKSVATSEVDGWIFDPKLTTETTARVEYTMALNEFNPKWVTLQNNTMLVTIPIDYLKWEVINTGSANSDNGSPSFALTDAEKGLKETNIKLIKTDLETQAKDMSPIVRNSAREDLRKLFEIPLKAAGVHLTVEVIFK